MQPVTVVRCAATRFKKASARLGVEQRLRESLGQAPGKAGPMNSHGLVLHSLQRMHAVSPDDLSRWVAQVDALRWIEQAARAFGRDRSQCFTPGPRDGVCPPPPPMMVR